MRTDAANPQPIASREQSDSRTGSLIRLRDPRLPLVLFLALLVGILSYQAPAAADVRVGWLGDQLFLPSTQALGVAQEGKWYTDEVTPDSSTGRSRWTRQVAQVNLPGLAAASDLMLTLRVQGWPDDVLNATTDQPLVTVSANGAELGSFIPTTAWTDYQLHIPASVATQSDNLQLMIRSQNVFTSTLAYADPKRPKGIRVERIVLQGADVPGPLRPAVGPVIWLVLAGGLLYLLLTVLFRRLTLAFVVTTLVVSGVGLALALARAWATAFLPWLVLILVIGLLLAERHLLVYLLRRLLYFYGYGEALNYGLVAAAAAWLAYIAIRGLTLVRPPSMTLFRSSFPDSLLFGALAMGLILLVVVRGRDGLPRLSQAIVSFFQSRRGSLLTLLIFLAIWIGYEAAVNFQLPYVGHADYADNAVVARNLVRGRGWVVDYVTQFYQLYHGVTHPQETWPLLQPVWIAPFLALFGMQAWAAKIPNLIFMTLLGLLVYAAGTRIWDRRIGLVAALITLTSQWFFFMAIQTTSDLAFVVFSFAAIYWLYTYVADSEPREAVAPPTAGRQRLRLLGAAICTGLLLLQKPGSGALIAAGMGIWFLAQLLRGPKSVSLWRRLGAGVLWGTIAIAILSPYLVRNIALFGTPFYSTESRDAWVLEYGDWEDIYKIFTPEAGLSETGGLPDRSWILRWGFDGTIRKLTNQVVAVRDYLAPAWQGLPNGWSAAVSGRKPLFFEMGAWLALLGLLGAVRRRGRLLALLVSAFVPYTLFLIFYWHANEERYFVVLMPWMALLCSYALWRGYERIAAIGDRRWTPVGLAMMLAALLMVIVPSWPAIGTKVRDEPVLWAPDVEAYTWLRDHTDPDAVVMTRLPWQLNWQADRPALMVPNTADREKFLQLARYYQVRYLVTDTLNNPSAATSDLINRMLEDPDLGMEEVYVSQPFYTIMNGKQVMLQTEIYRFPDDYGGVPALSLTP